MKRLALGTVQFGLPYGIANSCGQVSRNDASRILKLAARAGIDMLDTAIAYGESERILGEIGVAPFKIVTKLPAVPRNTSDVQGWVQKQVQGSLSRLGVPSLYGLLLHRTADLMEENGAALVRSLHALKVSGVVKKIGASVYAPAELDGVFQMMQADIVQAPLNVVDRRLEASGWLKRLQDQSVEVQLRSAFLQGLLLMPRSAIPPKFERWSRTWDAWSRVQAEKNVSAAAACLAYPLSLDGMSRVVVGVDSVGQLESLVKEVEHIPRSGEAFAFMVSDDECLINPSRWGEL
jgi:aryl-alcohol dehydrogenase-like predicted oxidoreductase